MPHRFAALESLLGACAGHRSDLRIYSQSTPEVSARLSTRAGPDLRIPETYTRISPIVRVFSPFATIYSWTILRVAGGDDVRFISIYLQYTPVSAFLNLPGFKEEECHQTGRGKPGRDRLSFEPIA